MRLHIIRHAEPDYSIDSLTSKGREEAVALRSWVARERPDRAYHSPLGRAKLTAALALEGSGLEPTEEGWTAELHDSMAYDSPHTWWDVDGHRIRRDEFLQRTEWDALPELAPTRARAEAERIGADSDEFLRRHGMVRDGGSYRIVDRCEFQSLAVFCHGGFGLTWFAHLLALPVPLAWAGFFMHPSSVTTLLFDEREPGIATPRVLHFGDLSHLHAAGLEPSRMGVKANYR